MSRGELLLLALATAVAWVGALLVLVALVRAAGLADRIVAVAEGLLADRRDEGTQSAEVHELAGGRPHLRLVVDRVGDEVERDVFPPDAA